MEDSIHEPHDKLFGTTFRIPENAAGLLRATLPEKIAAAINWSELRPLPGTFIDTQYQRSQTDLLFSVPISGRETLLYVLLEHQSTRDRMLPLRLLRYLVRIWEDLAKTLPSGARLPPILPMVLSQNAEVWELSPRFSDLLDLPEDLCGELSPFIPDFIYHHLQLAEMPFESIPGTPAGRYVLRAMKAERLGRLLDDAVWDDSLILCVPKGIFDLVLRYILGSDVDKEAFEDRLNKISDLEIKRLAMTLAERYHQEGQQIGQQIGQQHSIVNTLEFRLGPVPTGLRDVILAETNLERLDVLLRSAVTAVTYEVFAEAL